MEKPIELSIEKQLVEFYNHIDYQERIILSAKFGDGKTYFINKFKEKYKNEYLFLTIYPVNYQVAENRDIFEYVKRDILFQLCKYSLIDDKIDFEGLVKSTFDKETINELIDFLFNLINIAAPGSKAIGRLIKKIISTKEKYNKDKNTIEKYFKKFEEQPGVYEYDCFTKVITSVIENYKIKNPTKRVILIIEDLDRIDPAHLFRILNIFSAHIDQPYIDKKTQN